MRQSGTTVEKRWCGVGTACNNDSSSSGSSMALHLSMCQRDSTSLCSRTQPTLVAGRWRVAVGACSTHTITLDTITLHTHSRSASVLCHSASLALSPVLLQLFLLSIASSKDG